MVYNEAWERARQQVVAVLARETDAAKRLGLIVELANAANADGLLTTTDISAVTDAAVLFQTLTGKGGVIITYPMGG